MGYVTVDEYKAYMVAKNNAAGETIPKYADDVFLQTLIDSATLFIEDETKRSFVGASQTRYFDSRCAVWNDPKLLLVDKDLISISAIVNGDGNSIPVGSAYLELPNTVPAYGIRLKSTHNWIFSGDGRVEVTGSWGYSATPNANVKHITCRIAYIFQMRRTATGDVEIVGTGSDVGGTLKYGSYIPSDVREWLKRHTRHAYGR